VACGPNWGYKGKSDEFRLRHLIYAIRAFEKGNARRNSGNSYP
jgi:hypothetical protein